MKNILKYCTQKNIFISSIIVSIIQTSDINNYIKNLVLTIYLTLGILFLLYYIAKNKPIGKKELMWDIASICIAIAGLIYIACKLT